MISLLTALPLLVLFPVLLLTGFAVFLQNRDATVNRLFLAAALAIAVHSLFEFLFRIAPNAEQARLWYALCFFRPLMFALVIHFVLHYTKRWESYDRPFALCIVYGPAVFFSVVNLFSTALRGMPKESRAGWICQLREPDALTYSHVVWIAFAGAALLYMIWRHCFEEPIWRRKGNLILAGLFTTIAVLAIPAIVLRRLFFPDLPDLTGPTAGLGGVILGGLMWRLKLLITPADIAEDILAIMPGSLILIGPDNSIIRANRSAEKLCRYRENELAGQNLGVLFDEHVVSNVGFENGQEKPTSRLVPGEIHTTIRTKHGDTKPVLLVANRMHDKNGEPIGSVLVATDLSYIKKTEEQLTKAQRLESLETIAGSIAHDFNNLLTSISASLSLARVSETRTQKNQNIDFAEKAAYLAAELTRQLLSFSKQKEPQKEVCKVAEILEEAAALSLRGTNVESTISVSKDLRVIEVDRYQILQILMNLLINSRQAMPDGGRVWISAQNREEVDDRRGTILNCPAVEIRIDDEGIGIAENVLKHVFDPFYTTKSKGSGLGLTIAHSVVEKHEGHIAIDSKEGIGTTVTILLPAYLGAVSPAGDALRSFTKRRGRILVMDDDDMVRRALGEMLYSMGFEVVHTRSGPEAIEAYIHSKTEQRPFHGVILDLTVGKGHGGKEAIGRLREIDPDIKAIISSGYPNDDAITNYRSYGFAAAIPKPFNMSDLDRVIGTVFGDELNAG